MKSEITIDEKALEIYHNHIDRGGSIAVTQNQILDAIKEAMGCPYNITAFMHDADSVIEKYESIEQKYFLDPASFQKSTELINAARMFYNTLLKIKHGLPESVSEEKDRRIRELEEALGSVLPFANEVLTKQGNDPDTREIFGYNNQSLNIGQMRKIAQALNHPKP